MDRDLFLAVLSMDSYDRGYGQGVTGQTVEPNVTKLGNAIIGADSSVLVDESDSPLDSALRFYRLAYDVTDAAVDHAAYVEDQANGNPQERVAA
jgi:hypothetical protein